MFVVCTQTRAHPLCHRNRNSGCRALQVSETGTSPLFPAWELVACRLGCVILQAAAAFQDYSSLGLWRRSEYGFIKSEVTLSPRGRLWKKVLLRPLCYIYNTCSKLSCQLSVKLYLRGILFSDQLLTLLLGEGLCPDSQPRWPRFESWVDNENFSYSILFSPLSYALSWGWSQG